MVPPGPHLELSVKNDLVPNWCKKVWDWIPSLEVPSEMQWSSLSIKVKQKNLQPTTLNYKMTLCDLTHHKVQSSNPKGILPHYWITIEETSNYLFLSKFWLFTKNVPKNSGSFWTILINWFAGLCRFFWRKNAKIFDLQKRLSCRKFPKLFERLWRSKNNSPVKSTQSMCPLAPWAST